MDVKPQPITLFADKSRSEIGLVTGGLRITMTGVEALELWTELGDMLRALCGTRPENFAPTAASLLQGRSEPGANAAGPRMRGAKAAGGDTNSAKRPISHTAKEPLSPAAAASDRARRTGLVERTLGKLTGR